MAGRVRIYFRIITVFDGRKLKYAYCPGSATNRWHLVTKTEVEKLISERYQSLPPKLRVAARYVLDAPKEVAIQSMRSVAANAGLQPAAMLRFARELGFDSYESFRALYVSWLSSSEMTFV